MHLELFRIANVKRGKLQLKSAYSRIWSDKLGSLPFQKAEENLSLSLGKIQLFVVVACVEHFVHGDLWVLISYQFDATRDREREQETHTDYGKERTADSLVWPRASVIDAYWLTKIVKWL